MSPLKSPARRAVPILLIALCTALSAYASAQTPEIPNGTPLSWAESAATNQLAIINDDGAFPLRYRLHKVDAKSDTTREVIETRQGNVARLVQRNGRPLTTAEDAAEKSRLNQILSAPDDFIRHHKHDADNRKNALELVRLMPQAMIYTYAPGQPQLPGQTSLQVVLDFRPDPSFHPPTMLADLLTGLSGRMWIDAKTRRVTRAESRVLHPVYFGWGLVGRVAAGGTLVFEQANTGSNRWVYSYLETNLTVRVVVKNIPMRDRESATDFRPLPGPLSFQDAVRLLLATPVPLR